MLMKNLLIPSLLCLTCLANPSLAIEVNNMSSSQAEGRTGDIPRLQVWPGAGLNLNFVAMGEYIYKVWLDDPSRITIDFDLPIDTGQAQIVHLRRIEGLEFDYLPATASTILTVVAQTRQGQRKIYQFQIGYGSAKPRYASVNINPDPRPQLRQVQARRQLQQRQIEQLEQGLAIAMAHNQSSQNEQVFSRVETMLSFMRSGMTAEVAAKRVNLSLSVIKQLEQLAILGKNQ